MTYKRYNIFIIEYQNIVSFFNSFILLIEHSCRCGVQFTTEIVGRSLHSAISSPLHKVKFQELTMYSMKFLPQTPRTVLLSRAG